ncbi:hypothetical protein JTE90_004602 [Oedothorax gibbosus]|uniref:Secreted protein n=1 Tax=Oedothorax gibbosus TaxID=931172 RepID=A0AAV6TD82_9ARAC|nr:hypothetical protein JTE90_004602 [Oedothorax gibbosus]
MRATFLILSLFFGRRTDRGNRPSVQHRGRAVRRRQDTELPTGESNCKLSLEMVTNDLNEKNQLSSVNRDEPPSAEGVKRGGALYPWIGIRSGRRRMCGKHLISAQVTPGNHQPPYRGGSCPPRGVSHTAASTTTPHRESHPGAPHSRQKGSSTLFLKWAYKGNPSFFIKFVPQAS